MHLIAAIWHIDCKTVGMQSNEVIAVLLAEAERDAPHSLVGAVVLVRDASGTVSAQSVSARYALSHFARTRFLRRGKPIFDPVLRMTLGYETEEVSGALLLGAP